MALANNSGGCLKSKRVVAAAAAADRWLDFGIVVRYTRGSGRKRIVISCNDEDDSPIHLTPKTPSKRRRCGVSTSTTTVDRSLLEAVPQEVLIRILLGVNHRVSKAISEATLIAKEWHFDYITPTIRAFGTAIDFVEDSSDIDEIEAPNAPLLRRFRSQLDTKMLSYISVALFEKKSS